MNINKPIVVKNILESLKELGLELDEEKREALYDVLVRIGIEMLKYYVEMVHEVVKDESLKEGVFDTFMRLIGLEYYDERKYFYGQHYNKPSN